ncbi:MAG: dUTP diphosphatase [Vicinamibacterales bacterium]|nr:dUTP diphosphatase [Vicinamibacterales bacterium]
MERVGRSALPGRTAQHAQAQDGPARGQGARQAVPAGLTALGAGFLGTGLALELPPGTEAQVRPRSGLALTYSVTVLNTPGTIDEGYRGEVGVILITPGHRVFVVRRGMKVAQLGVQPTLAVEIVAVDALSDTSRGERGFGSTG